MRLTKKIESAKLEGNTLCLVANGEKINLSFYREDILRVKVAFDETTDTSVYSLKEGLKEISADFKDGVDELTFSTNQLKVVIAKEPFALSIYDKNERLLHKDVAGCAYYEDGNKRKIHTGCILPGDHFYGFGESTGHLDKLGKTVRLAPKDAMGYDPVNMTCLYKHIPFFTKLNEKDAVACGFFYANSAYCTFDLGATRSNYWPAHFTYTADYGNVDYFFLAGPTPKDVVKEYTYLTGTSIMLPKYALGYLGSSMYYSELRKNSDDAILDFVDKAKAEDIPLDGFQLSSGYCTGPDAKRYVFTWNKDRFKKPKDFFAKMSKKGIVVSPNIKPGVLTSHPRIYEFLEKDIFVKDETGEKPAEAMWWGGPGYYVDYTKDDVRAYWKSLIKNDLIDYGVTSIWNDNCEYDGLIDDSARLGKNGEKSIMDHRVVMANEMCKLSNEALVEATGMRPFSVCRSGQAGIQSLAQVWAGDNYTSFESLKYNVATMLGLSSSGIANMGCDVCGFYGPAPSKELLVRWVQMGIFEPRFSIHSSNTDNTVTEPWMYPEMTQYVREAIKLRYRLFPYMYSLMREAAVSGLPIMRPLFMEFPEDKNVQGMDTEFMMGQSLLVAPVLDEGVDKIEVYFPAGTNWFDYFNGQEYEGGKTVELPVDLGSIPMFIKAGGVVVEALHQLNNLSLDVMDGLKITTAVKGGCGAEIYEDDGLSFDYKNGGYLLRKVETVYDNNLLIKVKKEGAFKSLIKDLEINVISTERSPFAVELSGEALERFIYKPDFEKAQSGWYFDMSNQKVIIKVKEPKGDYEIKVFVEEFDLLGM